MSRVTYEIDGFDSVSFGQRVRDAREELGLSQRALAVMVGVTPASINFIEKQGKMPSLGMAMQLSKELHLSLDYLLFGEEHIPCGASDIARHLVSLKKIDGLGVEYDETGIRISFDSFPEISNFFEKYKAVTDAVSRIQIADELESSWLKTELQNIGALATTKISTESPVSPSASTVEAK